MIAGHMLAACAVSYKPDLADGLSILRLLLLSCVGALVVGQFIAAFKVELPDSASNPCLELEQSVL